MFKKSWKTTSTGILAIVGSVIGGYFAYKAGNLNEGTIMALATSFLTGIGLLFSKDSDVTGGTRPV
jgi:hypothetical protein